MQGSGCGGLPEIEGQLVLKQRRWRGEEKGERGGMGRRGTNVSLEEGGQGH